MTYAPAEPGADPAAPGEGKRSSARRSLGCAFELLETLVLTIVIYLVIHNFVAQPFKVEQNSMIPTLLPEEYVLIDKLTPRWDEYHRGDIVVFQPPPRFEQAGVPFIKRVIGEPGDTVSLREGDVFVTPPGGAPARLDEPYLNTDGLTGAPVATLPRDASGTSEWVVPDGSYFVLGDNREASQDSRNFGPIGAELIVGRGWVRYFPLDRITVIEDVTYGAVEEATGSSARIHLSSSRP